ncbi:hypothetical protein SAY86_004277 [Trapa natans]|uniref:Uncharacterized protein n=1 Tax=Trapa natans TaxID=22666 RepID=A0AAN7MYF8_TRANT|nr:hypothetical protein SAY86_004277 [Trapa natans]
MEESEKRKERLRAMRMEAARAESSNYSEVLPGPSSLENPFAEAPGPLFVQEEPCSAPRFDYYTDPMSAFSGNKRRNTIGNDTQHNYPAPNHFTYPPGPLPSVSGRRNLETSSPSHANQWQTSYSPCHAMYQPHTPHAQFQGQGMSALPPPPPMSGGVRPRAWNGPNFHHQYTNASGGGDIHNPNFVQGSPIFSPRHGNPNWQGNNPPTVGPGTSSGRGRAHGSMSGGSPSFRGGGRGIGFHGRGGGYGTGEPRGAGQFYHGSMIEDPWKDMVPVIWTPIGAPSSSSWMPESIRSKKPRVAESSNKFGGLNLAEFLAANFEEAASETDSTRDT